MALDESKLARLIDRQDIWDCMLRYVRGVDRMDEALIRSAFWEDAYTTHGPVHGTVDIFVKHWRPAQDSRECSFHIVSNQSAEIDGNTANCEAYFIGGFKLKTTPEVEVVGGRYIEEYEKRNSEWRIKARLVVVDWQGLMDGSQMKERLTKRHLGSRDRNDPSYERPLVEREAIKTAW